MVVVEEWWLISQVSQAAGVAENTCRRYVKLFPEIFESKTTGRTTKYNPDAVEKIQYIVEQYGQGKNTEEIRDQLPQAGYRQTINMDDDKVPVVVTPAIGIAILAQISATMEKIADQDQQIQELREQVSALVKEKEIDQRDRELLEQIRQRQNMPWWKKIF